MINLVYIIFERQDNLLVSWPLASMSLEILPQLIRCDTTKEVWKTIEQIFASQSQTKVMQYKFKL